MSMVDHAVLCVVSDVQRHQHQPLFDELRRRGADLRFQPDAEAGLVEVAAKAPLLIIVSMETDDMEGLEFVALATRQNPGLASRIIVLPEADDPFPPVLHYRDTSSGRYRTEQVDLADLPALAADAIGIGAVSGVAAAPASAPALAPPAPPSPAPPPAMVAPEVRMPAAAAPVMAAAPGLPAAPVPSVGFASAGGSRRLLIAAVVVLIVGLVVAIALLAGGDEQDQPTTGPDRGGGSASPAATAPVPPPATGAATASTATPGSPPRPAPGTGPLHQGMRLPLSFAPGHARYRVDDEARLGDMIEAFAAALEGDADLLVEIGGHASQEGKLVHNRTIAHERALAVHRLLSRKLPPERLVIRSYAAAEPTGEGPEHDRRVTLRLIDQRRLPSSAGAPEPSNP